MRNAAQLLGQEDRENDDDDNNNTIQFMSNVLF